MRGVYGTSGPCFRSFEQEYGCHGVYAKPLSPTKMMYTKLGSGGSYDVIIPSDYMIERLIKEEACPTDPVGTDFMWRQSLHK